MKKQRNFWNQYLIFTCWSPNWATSVKVEANISTQKEIILQAASKKLGTKVECYELSTSTEADVSLKTVHLKGVAIGNEVYTEYYAFKKFNDALDFVLTFNFGTKIVQTENDFLVFKYKEDLKSWAILNGVDL